MWGLKTAYEEQFLGKQEFERGTSVESGLSEGDRAGRAGMLPSGAYLSFYYLTWPLSKKPPKGEAFIVSKNGSQDIFSSPSLKNGKQGKPDELKRSDCFKPFLFELRSLITYS